MKILLIIAVMILIGSWQARAEPLYQGKPESFWVSLLANQNSYEFQLKWRELGTNRRAVLMKAVEVSNIPNAETIRSNAAWQLQSSGDTAILIRLARKHFDPQVRALAFNGLVFNSDKSITQVMVDSLRDTNAMVREAAVAGLGLTVRQFIPGEMPALVKCLQDTDANVRNFAATILCAYDKSGYTDVTLDEIAEAALPEIKSASTNADANISNAATKALKNYLPIDVLYAYTRELAISLDKLNGTKWTATVKVMDENNGPISDAAVSVGYYVPDFEVGEFQTGWQEIKGVTDSNGVFNTSYQNCSGPCGFSAGKDGYYSSRAAHEAVLFKDNDPAKWNPIVTLVLKKKIRPIPMYFNRVDIAYVKRPAFDKPIGFDLTVGDWVAPYGKGTNAYMFFTWHLDKDTNDVSGIHGNHRKHIWDEKMTINFPNPGDGIQEFDATSFGSELRSPQEAPTDGYRHQLFKEVGSRPNDPDTNTYDGYDNLHKNYFLRVSTVLDKDGNVKSAQYGKIYGDFEQAFSVYLSPETNSQDIEFDMKHNLGRGGGYMAY